MLVDTAAAGGAASPVRVSASTAATKREGSRRRRVAATIMWRPPPVTGIRWIIRVRGVSRKADDLAVLVQVDAVHGRPHRQARHGPHVAADRVHEPGADRRADLADGDRKSTRLNSSHVAISYAVF